MTTLVVRTIGEAGLVGPDMTGIRIARRETRLLLERLTFEAVLRPATDSASVLAERLIDDLYDGQGSAGDRIRRTASDLRSQGARFRPDAPPLVPKHARRGDQALYSLHLLGHDRIDAVEFLRLAREGLQLSSSDRRAASELLQEALTWWPDENALPFEELALVALPGSALAIELEEFRADAQRLRSAAVEALSADDPIGFEHTTHTREWGPFVGRDDELAKFNMVWGADRFGSSVFLVEGEPGVGKSRFADEAVRRLNPKWLWWGRCFPGHFSPEPAFGEVLRRLLDFRQHPGPRNDDDRAKGSAVHAASPETLVGFAYDQADARSAMLNDLVLAASSAGNDGGLVVVLDDLHEATLSTLRMMEHLASASLPNVVIIATLRDTKPDLQEKVEAAVHRLGRLPHVERLSLAGLNAEVLAALAPEGKSRQSEAERQAWSEQMLTACGGNPLLLGELLIDGPTAAKTLELERPASVPTGVVEHVRTRLLALTDDVAHTLEWAAVVGTEFEPSTLAEVLDTDADTVLDRLEVCVQAKIVAEQRPDRFVFAHSLVQAAVVSQQSSSRLARRHLAVARSMARTQPGSIPDRERRIALHYGLAALPGHESEAAEAHLHAGYQLYRDLSYEDAAAFAAAGRALLSQSDTADNPGLEALLWAIDIVVASRLGQRRRLLAATEAAAEAATRADSPLLFANAVYFRLGHFAESSYSPETIELGYEALRRLEGLPEDGRHETARAQLLSAMAGMMMTVPPKYAEPGGHTPSDLAAEAVVRAQRSGEPLALAASLIARFASLWAGGDVGQQIKLADELIPLERPWGYRLRPAARLMAGDRAGFEADIDALENIGHEQKDPWSLAHALQLRGVSLLLDGDLDAVEKVNAFATEIGGDQPALIRTLLAQLVWLSAERGELAATRPGLAAAIEENPGIPGFRALLALACLSEGDLDSARRELYVLAEDGFAGIARDHTFASIMAGAAETAAHLGERELARSVFELLLPWSGLTIVIGSAAFCIGATDRYLGMLAHLEGDTAAATDLLERAERLERRIDAPALWLRTCYWQARLLGGERAEPASLTPMIAECDQRGLLALANLYQGLLSG